ncbi:MAG: peptidylprolyl isomerase [Geobacter sp.]|nr:peptidylprolyl isomerase [Geobacter sp.]
MAKAKSGDKVKVHYTGRLDNGDVFDSSECVDDECGCESGPLEFVIGEGNVIPGFENAVIDMEIGESKTVHIPVEEAYGPRMEELVAVLDKSEVPAGVEPEAGQQMEVTLQDDSTIPVLVTEVSDTTVTLDANHPLAGQNLNFDIRLVEIA